MIITSLYSIAEKVKHRLGKGEIQAYISVVTDALATAVKNEWYQGRNDGINEIAGQFLYTFGKTTPLIPTIEPIYNLYQVTIPSSYVSIPYEIGITQVSCATGRPFIRLESATWRNYLETKAGKALGAQPYFTENTLMYFPLMTMPENIYMVLAVAYTTINPREQINLAPNVIDAVVDIVCKKYEAKPAVLQDNTEA